MKTLKRTITLREKIMKTIDQQAKEENRNFSNMVETILLKHLEQNGRHVA